MRWLITTLLFFNLATVLKAEDWPKEYIVAEDSLSPNKRYGILVPHSGDIADGDFFKTPNYLVDIENHRVLGKIENLHYGYNENHWDLIAIWDTDSRMCVAVYDARFGFYSVELLQLTKNGFSQTDLGTHIQKSLDVAIEKKAPSSEDECYGQVHLRIQKDQKITFYVLGGTNPKGFEDRKTYRAFFRGTYDAITKKWLADSAQSINEETDTNLSSLFSTYIFEHVGYGNDEKAKAKDYTQKLNEVYAALQFLLPAKKFEKIEASHTAWLKIRNPAQSLAEKNTLTKTRILELQELAWQVP